MHTLVSNWEEDYHQFIVVIRNNKTWEKIDYDEEMFETCADAIDFARKQLELLRKVKPDGLWQARVILESSTRILLME